MDANERLQELLDRKDEELEEARERVRELERELDAEPGGWRRPEVLPDDASLPVPRLELVYQQDNGWAEYRVTYRLVMRHFLGQLLGLPLGMTRCQSSAGERPADLPYRDGAHALHDAAHLGLPLYRMLPGEAPELASDDKNYAFQKGLAHRRSSGSPTSEPPPSSAPPASTEGAC